MYNGKITKNLIPEKIFIIPYRNREPHKMVFNLMMKELLKDTNYQLLYIHQKDKRPFNRGAIKNIGFLYVKTQYPLHWENITLIFHDIDCLAYKENQFSFNTTPGTINHFFGFKHTLGGIFAIKGGDFGKTSGFPNIWTWGLEDNIIWERAKAIGLKVKYDEFLHAQNDADKIVSLWHGWNRLLNPDVGLSKTHYHRDSVWSIKNLRFYDEDIEDKIKMVHVMHFDVPVSPESHLVKNARIKNARHHRVFKSWRREAIKKQTKNKGSKGLILNFSK
jgi:hypothetical protein